MTRSDRVYYKGKRIKAGEIVSIKDKDGGLYYAQIRELLTSKYGEKSALLTKLVSTQKTLPPEKEFNPAAYDIGPEEDGPRKLKALNFVMALPLNFYTDRIQRIRSYLETYV